MDIHIRWMIRRDMLEVMGIDDESFSNPWTEEELCGYVRRRNTIAMVAEAGDNVVGFMVYELHRTRIELLKIAVAPEARRQLVGDMLIAKLRGRLSKQRTRILASVDERNLPAQLFFKAMGFLATEIVKDQNDSYVFELYKGERVTA